jgi:hypothetical protein
MAQTIEIIRGNFSTGLDVNGKPKKGNFSAYDEDGEQYFINKSLLVDKGINTDAEAKGKFPMWVRCVVKPCGSLDASGQPLVVDGKAVTSQRAEITRLYDSYEQSIQSDVNKAARAIDVASGIEQRAKTAGLGEQAINNIMANSSF